jgi:hypothetical protein
MDSDTLRGWLEWIGLLAGLLAFVTALVTALWAYTRFIVERGILPAVQFSVDCNFAGRQRDKLVIEVLLHLRNIGTQTLDAKNIRVDVLYMDVDDSVQLFSSEEGEKPVGRLNFRGSVRKDVGYKAPHDDDARKKAPTSRTARGMFGTFLAVIGRRDVDTTDNRRDKPPRGMPILKHDTFVQPGVDQVYPFPTAVPGSTSFLLVYASFEYAQAASLVQRFALFLSRRLGLIQYSLRHVNKRHTIERIFGVEQIHNNVESAS